MFEIIDNSNYENNANLSLKIKSLLMDFWLFIWSWFYQE